MNCRKVTHLLSAYIDGELPGVEHRQIHDHIAGCAECAEEHRGLVQMKRMLAGMRMREPAADLPQRILSQVHAQPASHSSWLNQLNRWVQIQGLKPQSLALAASFALGGIVFASYTIDRAAEESSHAISFQQMTPAQLARLQPAPIEEPSLMSPPLGSPVPVQAGSSVPYLQADYPSYDYYPVRRTILSPRRVYIPPMPLNRLP